MRDFLIGLAALLYILKTCDYYLNLIRRSKKDGTDPEKGTSGLVLYTDHGTGQQYLSSILGGITPRLGRTLRDVDATKK